MINCPDCGPVGDIHKPTCEYFARALPEYTFDFPAVVTARVRYASEDDARALLAGFDHIEGDCVINLRDHCGTTPWPGTVKVTCLAARGRPHLHDAVDANNNTLPHTPETLPDPDTTQLAHERLTDLADDINNLAHVLPQWEHAIGDDGSNDEEHELGHEMYEAITALLDKLKTWGLPPHTD